MADYSKVTNFAVKDELPQNNPAKVIQGVEFDTEFNAVAIAVTTKLDVVPVYPEVDYPEIESSNVTVNDNTVFSDGVVVNSVDFTMVNPNRKIYVESSVNYTVSVEANGNYTANGQGSFEYYVVNKETNARAKIALSEQILFESRTVNNAKNNTLEFLTVYTVTDMYVDSVVSDQTVQSLVGVSNSGYTLEVEADNPNISNPVLLIRINQDGVLVVKEIV